MTKLGVLRILLIAIGVLSVLAGLILMFATNWIFSLIGATAESGFFFLILKAIGAVSIALGYASLATSRDPERNVVVVDLLIIISLLAAAVGFYSQITLHFTIGHVSAALIWTGSTLRLILGLVLLALRPR
jgi:hypothetical protein